MDDKPLPPNSPTAPSPAPSTLSSPIRRRGARIAAWLGGATALLVALVVAAVHWFGPMAGITLRGEPVFLVPPSPERYAAVSLDAMETMGFYGRTPEFAAARAEAERMLDEAAPDDYAGTWPALDYAIRAAGGKHSKVLRPDSGTEPATDTDTSAPSPSASPAPSPATDVDPSVTARDVAGGRVIVATVPTHGGDFGGPHSQSYADALAGGIARENASGACGAIVDLRGNGGGDMGPMVAGLSALLPDGEILWFDAPGNSMAVTLSGGSVRGGGSAVSVESGPKLDVPVAVLVDGGTASSGEATMLAFRGLGDARSFGAPTAGYASANTVIRMPGGMRLILTVARDRDRTGAVHMDDPVQPDEVTGDDRAETEAAALAWLAERGCG